MKLHLSYLLLPVLLFACGQNSDEPQPGRQRNLFVKPANFPEPSYPVANNPVTTAGFKLGRALFYDGVLSKDNTMSCGSCHVRDFGFAHPEHDAHHDMPHRQGRRNAPGLQNLAWQTSYFLDGRVHDLDKQPVAVIENPDEMDEQLSNVLEKLRKHPRYPPLFKAAFGTGEITSEHFLKALSQFTTMLISANSRYDKYMRKETGGTLTPDELAGMNLVAQKCSPCHSGVFFSDQTYRDIGLGIGITKDEGRYEVTFNPADRHKFKVPGLRNVVSTAPYMHDGRLRTLKAVLDHYSSGVQPTSNLDPLLNSPQGRGIPLTEEEKQKIIAFLNTLTDKEFLSNPAFEEY